MEKHGICDYSLLVGVHIEGRMQDKFHQQQQQQQQHPGISRGWQKGSTEFLDSRSAFRRDHGGIVARGPGGERKNEVYFIGIIDILTVYNFKKKSEHTLKSIFHDSVLPPSSANIILPFTKNRFLMVFIFWNKRLNVDANTNLLCRRKFRRFHLSRTRSGSSITSGLSSYRAISVTYFLNKIQHNKYT